MFSKGIVALLLLASVAPAAELSLVPVGSTTVNAEQPVTVEVFLDGINLPDLLRGYQVTLEVIPQAGAVGTMGLVDPVTPQPNPSIFVDKVRSDWVFASAASNPFVASNAAKSQIVATVFDTSDSVAISSPRYAATYIFKSSPGAEGVFTVRFARTDPVNPGVELTQLIGSVSGQTFSFTTTELTITVAPQVDNDACVDRRVASSGDNPFSTIGATTDGPSVPLTCDDGNGIGFGQDVWFEHVATCTGLLIVSTCGTADFNTRLAVYGTGATACSCPTDNTTLLACNDDAPGCASGSSEVVLSVTAGACLTVRVGGLDGASGTGTLNISCIPDLCADALRVSSNSTTRGSTENTVVNDNIGPDCGGGAVDSPGAWYIVSGTGDRMTVSLSTAGTFDTRLTIYQGACGTLACEGDDDVPGNGGESVSWCSQLGIDYRILVHGVAGVSGSFVLNVESRSCDDGNQCTNDSCSAGVCVNTGNFDSATECCVPSTRTLTPIDDGNPCTDDACNAATGTVSHTAKPDGPTAGCDDGNQCTTDVCLSGACVSTDINGRVCAVDGDCPGDATCVNDACECVSVTFELIASPGTPAGCYAVGDIITVRVELGPIATQNISPDPIIGANLSLVYDPTTMLFVDASPGATVDPASPFRNELQENVDAGQGTIDYLVNVDLFTPGTRDSATLAVITFQVMAECNGFVAFRRNGPVVNRLSLIGGEALVPTTIDPPPYKFNSIAPVLTACPGDITASPDAGEFTTRVSWTSPTATDGCEPGLVPVVCTPASGSAFSAGTTSVTCSATDSCGRTASCGFNVNVGVPELRVNVELSPTVNAAPFARCITFDLWDCNAPSGSNHATVEQTLVFSGGLASGVVIPIPGGSWTCLTARDRLHTLTSTATDFTTTDGIVYTASFVGPRSTGGHWLIGGNLNDDDFIDILDFGVFFPKFLTQASASTPCGVSGPDANLDGDGTVGLTDLVFVSGNSLNGSEPVCCGGVAAVQDGPIVSISVRELRSRGLGYMAVADVNRDGTLDFADIAAFLSGDFPPAGTNDPRRGDPPVKAPRGSAPRSQR